MVPSPAVGKSRRTSPVFELLDRLDVDVDVGGVFRWDDGSVEVVRIDHREHDGLSAATVLLTGAGYGVEPPRRRPVVSGEARWRDWPGIWQRFRRDFRDRQVPWREEHPSPGRVPPLQVEDENFGWICWDETESDRIVAACAERGVSVNALLLWGLSRTVAPLVADDAETLPWIMPVDLRRRGLAESDETVATSGVMMDLGRADTPEDVHRQLMDKVAERTYLAYWWVTERLPTMLPKAVLWPILKSKEQGGNRCMGGCTYLGDLDEWVTADRPDREIETMTGFNLLSRQFPVQSVGVRWNGRLTFSLRLHPFIWAGDVSPLVESWKQTVEDNVQLRAQPEENPP